MHGLSLASQFCRQLVSELGHLIGNFLVCTDAKITIFWSLSDSLEPKTIFVENRTQLIRSSIQTSIDLLLEEQSEEEGTGDLKIKGNLQKNYKDILFWIPSPLNKSDCGTKYLTSDGVNPNMKMLTAEDIDPELKSGQDITWMSNIKETIKNKIIISARDIENQKKGMEDDLSYKSGFKNVGATKIKEQASILLRDSEGKSQVYKVNTGSEGGENKILTLKDPENQPKLSGGDQNQSKLFGGTLRVKTYFCQVLKKMTQKCFPYWG